MRARLEIETILFRVSAMLQGDRYMVFGIKDGAISTRVPVLKGSSTKKLSGTPGYIAHVESCARECVSSQTPSMLPNPDHAVSNTQLEASFNYYPDPEGLFIAESARLDVWSRSPHAIARMYETAIRKKWVWSFDIRPFSS